MTSQHAPFLVDVRSLRARAEAAGLDLPLVVWDESCSSTNDELAALVRKPEHLDPHPAEAVGHPVRDVAGAVVGSGADRSELPVFTVLGTDFQSAGHGRLGRTWTVPPRKSLTFSILLAPRTGVESWGWIPLLTGEAVRRAVAEAGVPAVLKWPNDVLTAEGKKLCGILARIEMIDSGPRIVLGMGINTRLAAEDLVREDASSLAIELGQPDSEIDHEALLVSILSTLIPALREIDEYGDEDFSRSRTAEKVREGMVTLGTRVKVERPDGSHLIGTATGLDPSGDLIIDDRTTVSAGDVHHLRPAPGTDTSAAGTTAR
ncbi:biotin--[acetyl-CoA-carboxylase] ligase [Brevibacterium casei]|uniref:Biotin--acetyl-CoA-carboxylase ligase n=2 Tax=Brevibacterium casei TaxID=33889 RepID=K9AP76_9MICO|nr:biotin--[acetyl-CoA-carboxylase] ligase [Brevibacterium casei]EKU49223.1 biotin--acetyl-CoA-carboxylase ligase [Brevibacterium casei S18]KZE22163.1 biotin--acetyl-CoA-carboxylase ligase [Brevibacterium casei]